MSGQSGWIPPSSRWARTTSSFRRGWREHVATEERQRCMRRVEALDRELSGRGGVQQPEAAALSALKQEENFALESQRAAALRVAEECDVTVALEEAKFAQWRKENMRRKHDYVPFAVKLLDVLAEKVSVKEITNEAKTDFKNVVDSMKSKAKHREDARTSAGEGSEGFK
ncbi:F1E22.3 [Ectocarpus siliculosus]|uniref:F1E22.3 n=1 Tax=Ectocarpus siliculosus TaxID=2880 RepID=D7G5X4_ECTSI|nr:F1E22.3 [Ectocarpus siliculosus]|eukprot:CBJ27412.1 F1E22.3 [Ectocarpus siliculosus]